MINQYEMNKIERLSMKAENLISIINGTYEGTEAEKEEVLTPEIFEAELPTDHIKLLRLNNNLKQ